MIAGIYHWFVRGDGYQITSGPIIVLSAWAWGISWYRHHTCHHAGCWWPGHKHPEHGWPSCRRHWHETPEHIREEAIT